MYGVDLHDVKVCTVFTLKYLIGLDKQNFSV